MHVKKTLSQDTIYVFEIFPASLLKYMIIIIKIFQNFLLEVQNFVRNKFKINQLIL